MKKMILFILAAFFTASLASADDVITTDIARLPEEARQFITDYFPTEKISYIKIDNDILSTVYEVILENGTEIDFESDGKWKEIDTKINDVPLAIIHPRIIEYVNAHYGRATVKEIRKKKREYEIELSNRLELEFDLNGNFIRIDEQQTYAIVQT